MKSTTVLVEVKIDENDSIEFEEAMADAFDEWVNNYWDNQRDAFLMSISEAFQAGYGYAIMDMEANIIEEGKE